VHRNLSWYDLVDLRFQNDNSSALITYQPTQEDEERLLEFDGMGRGFDLSKHYNGPEYEGWLRLQLRKPLFHKQLQRLEDFTDKQRKESNYTKGFIWEISPVVYQFQDEYNAWAEKNNVSECSYWKNEGAISNRVGAKVLEKLDEYYPDTDYFVNLHIRRGDAKHQCDSTLNTMNDFLGCSLKNTQGFGNITIMLGSDERDPCYRAAIKSLVEGQGSNIRLGDMDATIKQVIDEYASSDPMGDRLLNNMFLYKVSTDIYYKKKFKFHLERRRHHNCWPCPQVATEFHNRGYPVVKENPNVPIVNFQVINSTYNRCVALKNAEKRFASIKNT
jgi:hypothetical protein